MRSKGRAWLGQGPAMGEVGARFVDFLADDAPGDREVFISFLMAASVSIGVIIA